ncbi:MAG: sodium/proton-translocating pyrophosphatase, partial [Firmicutes bacterium]|nr:sodium/proton-translocating pyrophosphatase [Bacillota bacterium]
MLIVAPIAGVLALIFAFILTQRINKMDEGNDRMSEIAAAIHSGAMAFLGRQYKTLIIFVLIMAVVFFAVGTFTTGEDSIKATTAIPF